MDRVILPLLLPLGVAIVVALMVSGLGTLLLTVGEGVAVPVALLMAFAILGIAIYLDSRPTHSGDRPP